MNAHQPAVADFVPCGLTGTVIALAVCPACGLILDADGDPTDAAEQPCPATTGPQAAARR